MQTKPVVRGIVVLLTFMSLPAVRSHATVVTLTDQNSTASFIPDSQNGQYNWLVDGVDQLAQQWFWYRIDNNPEKSIDSIGVPVIVQSTPSSFSSTYTGPTVEMKTTYSLFGGSINSGNSDLAEQIRIKNLTGAPMSMHFFQYVDFDLNGTPIDALVSYQNNNTVTQSDGPISLSETVNTTLGAASTHREVNFFPVTLNKLNDGAPTTLNDFLGPLGPGNLTWAFQWDFTIAPGGTAIISKNKILSVPPNVPEPGACALLLLGCGLVRRRRSGR